jgi:sulfide:quinone oxidoreductase
MSIERIEVTDGFSVSTQVELADVSALADAGVKSLICNRPDGEGADQPTVRELRDAAERRSVSRWPTCPWCPERSRTRTLPISAAALERLPAPVTCLLPHGHPLPHPLEPHQRKQGRGGTNCSQRRQGARLRPVAQALGDSGDAPREVPGPEGKNRRRSLRRGDRRRRRRGHRRGLEPDGAHAGLSIAIIDPAEVHYYQPGWTMVGGGVFRQEDTVKTMASLIPEGVRWIKAAVGEFEPDNNRVLLEDRHPVSYDRLIVAPGLKLDWHGVEGLVETLGRNGVTSNYRFDLAPYTWQLVSSLRRGRAVFTQPPMPIKCAGAPQKAMYLSADHWNRSGVLKDIDIAFYNAGAVLFGVKEYVPALMEYVERYGADLNFGHRLTRIDGDARTAWFETSDDDGNRQEVSTSFDMIHVCPPQTAPDFVRQSSPRRRCGLGRCRPEHAAAQALCQHLEPR